MIVETAISQMVSTKTNSASLAIFHNLVKICCGTHYSADHSFYNHKVLSCEETITGQSPLNIYLTDKQAWPAVMIQRITVSSFQIIIN